MSFLPKEFKMPEKSNYMKLKDGENTLRILTPAVYGYSYWNQQGKPVRMKDHPGIIPKDIRVSDGKIDRIKHFWAFMVWNYDSKQVQLLEVTQATIQNALLDLVNSKTWGDPSGYDITIKRSGEGLDTTYTVMPLPHSAVSAEIAGAHTAKKYNLQALFEGKDPFAADITAEEIDF